MLLLFEEFDIILGIDWLTMHDAIVNYRRKKILLKCQDGRVVKVESNRCESSINIISALSTHKCIRKGCDAYLAYILGTKVSELKIKSVLIACEFVYVLLKNYRGCR